MQIYRQLITLAIVGTVAGYAHAKALYNPSQLEHFEQTNECVGCDLSSARITPNHSGANLERANLSNLAEKPGSGELNLSSANLKNANLSNAYLEFANLSYADLTGAHLDGAYVRYANFAGAVGVDLKNAAGVCSVILPDGSLTKECDGQK